MKVHVEPEPMTASLRVYVFEPRGGGIVRTYRMVDPQSPQLEGYDVEYVVKAEPTFVLDQEVMAELIRAASGVLPATDATVDALKDTREVRDRLLNLVETLSTPLPVVHAELVSR